METINLLQIAFKKLKSSVYYDKTQLILRQKLVEWEVQHDVDDELSKLSDDLIGNFESLCNRICDSISYRVFPKKLENSKTEESNILFNFTEKDITVKELQYFIDMDIEGHILGVLWLMMAGYKIDEQIYEHSYGNRIRKNLRSEFSNECTYSPYLFEPYFQQYESWRDKALNQALEHLKSNQDVVVITMDFKRYFYSVDMNDEVKEQLINALEMDSYSAEKQPLIKNLSDFIFKVFDAYSKKCTADEDRTILPIGFLPSNVLSNWYLNTFDKAISDGWNPIYYGRYVDDILIIDKVEKNSDLYEKAAKGILTRDDIISLLLMQCSKWCGMNKGLSSQENALLIEDKEETKKATEESGKTQIMYRVNPKYHSKGKGKILLQNSKVNIFYFKSGESDALITCFKKKIAINASEFRHMPDDETFYRDDDYSDIYHLENEESPNKFRGIKSISLDKYELSKFLGKHLRIGSMISDKGEYQFIKDINKIFTPRIIIQYYDMWERIIEVFVADNSFSAAVDFINKVLSSITNTNYSKDNENTLSEMRNALYLHLNSAICRAFSLVWGPNVVDAISKIDIGSDCPFSKEYESDTIKYFRIGYLKTKMMDKSVMPIFIDLIDKVKLNDKSDVNLTCFQDVVSLVKKDNWKSGYLYYPYMITMYDISIISSLEQMKKDSDNFYDIKGMITGQADRFVKYNFGSHKSFSSEDMVNAVHFKSKRKNKMEIKKAYLVSAGSSKKSLLKIAVANVSLSYDNFDKLIRGKPNRSYKRYKELADIVNAAINQHADMLVMPESYIPFEWLTILARTCAKSNLAVVTGVEHVVFDKKVFNLTAVILPFTNQEYNYSCANISFHLKNYLSPLEKELIRGYRLNGIEGNTYELYKWNDCYFPVYCCYELASIRDRAIFQSYADFLVAIEWNKDTNYYSNILESLSRDIHCYCVQVNSSVYGDSRITKPSKTEDKDILRTKGGSNSTILVGQIDIGKLRSFQIKENNLQQNSHDFKMTPPEFDAEIVLNKIKGDILGNNQ